MLGSTKVVATDGLQVFALAVLKDNAEVDVKVGQLDSATAASKASRQDDEMVEKMKFSEWLFAWE